MNPFKHPKVAFQFVSHRVLRWSITPVALLLLIPLNILLVWQGAGLVYDVILFLQIAFYLMAAVGYILSKMGRPSKLLNIPGYFIFMNVNVFRGMAYLRTHKTSGTWEKARRG
jgi:hypothetical protein